MKHLIATLLFVLPTLALAQVELETLVYKVVEVQQDNGTSKVEWTEANKIVPGDRVGYRISFKNTGQEPAGDVVLNNPVPDNTVYVAGSARGANSKIEFSVDGGKQYGTPDTLVVDKEGKKLPATAKDYTHVRWTLLSPLKSGEESSVQYVVQVK